jgi:hypothetical protein
MNFDRLERNRVQIDLARDAGPLELWRQGFGRGGINALPLSRRLIGGMRKLRPRLMRTFIQEFFDVYPEHGVFNWSKLDPYMESLAATGAQVLAAIAVKPKVLFPKIDEKTWRPNDVGAWQRLIAEMVRRYSVEREIVTHWNVGNEVDIGENGGTPFLTPTAEEYAEFYRMTITPILEVFPQAKVGGPAVADASSDMLTEFVQICRRDKLQLDFIAWHLYADDPDLHRRFIDKYRKVLAVFGERRPEMMVTEWNKGFDQVSVEDNAFDPRRAANAAAILIAMIDGGLDRSFYYHFLDQVCFRRDFGRLFAKPEIMYHHWNEVPHRFGLFGVNEEVRPQYFVFWMLQRLGDRRVAAESDSAEVRVLATIAEDGSCAILLVNFGLAESRDRVVTVRLAGLRPVARQLVSYRIDASRSWDAQQLEMRPVEARAVEVNETFECQVYAPADTVTLLELRIDEAGVTAP